jgi:hypothetical protein
MECARWVSVVINDGVIRGELPFEKEEGGNRLVILDIEDYH